MLGNVQQWTRSLWGSQAHQPKGWAFRALYAGLIKSDDVRAEKRGICVQLPPSEAEKAYLHYLQRKAHFEVD